MLRPTGRHASVVISGTAPRIARRSLNRAFVAVTHAFRMEMCHMDHNRLILKDYRTIRDHLPQRQIRTRSRRAQRPLPQDRARAADNLLPPGPWKRPQAMELIMDPHRWEDAPSFRKKGSKGLLRSTPLSILGLRGTQPVLVTVKELQRCISLGQTLCRRPTHGQGGTRKLGPPQLPRLRRPSPRRKVPPSIRLDPRTNGDPGQAPSTWELLRHIFRNFASRYLEMTSYPHWRRG